MNKIPKKGDYIVFIPEDGSKKISPISHYNSSYNFFSYPSLSYNKKYKVIDISHPFIIIRDNSNIVRMSHNFKFFNIKYKIITLPDKINKILSI